MSKNHEQKDDGMSGFGPLARESAIGRRLRRIEEQMGLHQKGPRCITMICHRYEQIKQEELSPGTEVVTPYVTATFLFCDDPEERARELERLRAIPEYHQPGSRPAAMTRPTWNPPGT